MFFFQYILKQQWQKVRSYANRRGVVILGDIPIYPNRNSFDVYLNPEWYLLDKNKNPVVFGGMPPDDFNKNGQCWGSCVYDWKKLAKYDYEYVIGKIRRVLDYYDILRIDHFIGYVKHWEIDAKNGNPLLGKWKESGGSEFFKRLLEQVDGKRLVVEDLGTALPEVEKVRKELKLKGMNVLQFASQEGGNRRYLPENVVENSLYYLGTHDNNTFIGFLKSLSQDERRKFLQMLKINAKDDGDICIQCVKKMLASKSDTIILQMQDFLLQDENFRINIPGQAKGCWDYRAPKNYKKTFSKTAHRILS